MTKQELLNKIKESLKSLVSLSAGEAVIGAIVSKDGSAIVDGTAVTFEDGSEVPDGEYTLADGSTIEVKDGKAVITAEAEEEVAAEETPAETELEEVIEDVQAEDAPATSAAPSVEDRLTALESMVSEILDILSTFNTANEVVMSKVNKLAEAPGAEPVKFSAVEKKADNIVADVKAELEKIRQINANRK